MPVHKSRSGVKEDDGGKSQIESSVQFVLKDRKDLSIIVSLRILNLDCQTGIGLQKKLQ